MLFFYDPNKSEANLGKHGIDFEEAKHLWDDEYGYEIIVEHRGERRMMLLARYAGDVWAAIFTMRGDAVRIISVRRATTAEEARYDRERNR